MPSAARGKCVNGVYHVFQRGNNRECLFNKDETKGMLIHIIKEFKVKFDFNLLGFVIMDNHYHFLIKVNKDPLDEIMFNINNVFAHYLNKTSGRSGHVYGTRYKSEYVDTDNYLLWLLRYIHRNPIRAKIVAKVDDYKWSSHYFYKKGINDTVNTDYILGVISSKKAQSILKYMKFVNADNNDDNYEEYKKCNEKFTIYDLRNNIEILTKENQLERRSLQDLASNIFIDEDKKALVFAGSKQRVLTSIKLDFIKEAILLKYTYKEIANFLNASESMVRTILVRHKS